MVSRLPSFMGLLNDTLSTEAVTTGQLQCFWEAIAAAMSIQCISLPPIRLPSVLVSFGKTNSDIITKVSFGCFVCIFICFQQWAKISLFAWDYLEFSLIKTA